MLLDLIMPEMDGFEFITAVQQNPAWREVPIIVITAADLSADDHRRLNGAVERILSKSALSRDELLAELHGLVARRTSARRVAG